MEIVILTICGIVALSSLSANLLVAYMVWQSGRHEHQKKTAQQQMEELPEEREARRAAAEAQRKYEQGFVDIMSYMGRPIRRDGDQ